MNYRQHQIQTPRLRTSLFTDPASIATNQQGLLTPEQLNALAWKNHSSFGGCLLIMIALLYFLFVTIVLIVAAFQGQSGTFSSLGGLQLLLRIFVLPLVLFGIGWIWFKRKQAGRERFKQDISSGFIPVTIERVQGEVVWDAKLGTYVVHTPGYVLQSLIGRSARGRIVPPAETLPPGPYHFYYVNEYNLIVSAQPIHTNTQMLGLPGTLSSTGLYGDEQARLAIQQALETAIGFTSIDLDANRQGMLSNEQLGRIRKRHRSSIVLQSIEGEIETRIVYNDEADNDYYYAIGGMRLEVPSQKAHHALVSGIRYRVYYYQLRRKNILLSVEPLEAPAR